MGYNRSGANRKARLRRRRREVARVIANLESGNREGQAQGGQQADLTREVRHLRKSMKLRT